jgi:hypothetical protein
MTDIMRDRALPNDYYQRPEEETAREREARLSRIRTNPAYSFDALFRQYPVKSIESLQHEASVVGHVALENALQPEETHPVEIAQNHTPEQ